MTPAEWISSVGVAVAILLGLYGVLRDNDERRTLRRLRERAQADRVVFIKRPAYESLSDFAQLVVHNGSDLPVTNVRVTSAGRDNEGERFRGWSMLSIVDAGESKTSDLDPDSEEEYMTSEYRVGFTDSAGRRWFRGLSGDPQRD